jgi:hypothetical protein
VPASAMPTAGRAAKANLLLQHGGHRRIGGPASRAQAPAVLCCPHPHDPRAEGCTQTLKPKACKTSTTKPGFLIGLRLDHSRWDQAAHGLPQSGLGLRSARRDAAASYLASLGACESLCAHLDRGYQPAHAGPRAAAALSMLNAQLPSPLPLAEALSLRQEEFD